MAVFNRLCMSLAFFVGLGLAILGTFGFFLGSSAHFVLPPILGGLPLLVGWGIVIAVIRAWDVIPQKRPLRAPAPDPKFPSSRPKPDTDVRSAPPIRT
ncbi:MAG: hypothetical protein KDB14_25450 [Planctomycetales bacterium]|nr:hypothetical protein [Planctomycetales bacterium]